MTFKKGQKVILSEHDTQSKMNLQVGCAGEVVNSKPSRDGWIYCYWPSSSNYCWWVDSKCLKLARTISLENK